MAKDSQLQIRVSPEEKSRIQRAAQTAGMDMSSWVLSRLLPREERSFHRLVSRLADEEPPSFALAELGDFLAGLSASGLRAAVAERPVAELNAYLRNYVAAMVECAALDKGVEPPTWLAEIEPLATPVFGSELESLRLHLLTQSPPPFRKRNIFVDATARDRV